MASDIAGIAMNFFPLCVAVLPNTSAAVVFAVSLLSVLQMLSSLRNTKLKQTWTFIFLSSELQLCRQLFSKTSGLTQSLELLQAFICTSVDWAMAAKQLSTLLCSLPSEPGTSSHIWQSDNCPKLFVSLVMVSLIFVTNSGSPPLTLATILLQSLWSRL